MIYLELIDLKTLKTFKKYFKTEYDRQKFMNKLKYSKKLKIINSYSYMWGVNIEVLLWILAISILVPIFVCIVLWIILLILILLRRKY